VLVLLDGQPLVGTRGIKRIVAEIFADRARSVSQDPAHEVVVIVAHGPNEDAENARARR